MITAETSLKILKNFNDVFAVIFFEINIRSINIL